MIPVPNKLPSSNHDVLEAAAIHEVILTDKTMIGRSPTPIDFLPNGPVELPYIYADGLAFAEPRDPAWLDAWLESQASAVEVEFIGTSGPGPAAA